jgi:hypothetical protein
MTPADSVQERTLRELVALHADVRIRLVGMKGGFRVEIESAGLGKVLSNTRGRVRQFASLNTATDLLRELGVLRFEVDASNYEPGRIRSARPDRAEALKRTRTRPKQQELI